jgi:Spy/CpxP family protein refolding chaperone
MNYFLKQKTWFFIALFFIVVNVVLLCGMFIRKGHHGMKDHGRYPRNMHEGRRNHGPGFYITRMLTDSLGFSQEQHAKLQRINEEMDLKKDSLIHESESARQMLVKEMYAAQPNSQRLDSLIEKVSSLTGSFNRLRAEHVNRIRLMCTEEQKKKFPVLFEEYQDRRDHQRNINR